MIVRNLIWEEITQSHANAICARKYATIQRRIELLYKVLIPVLAALCTLLSALSIYKGTTITAAVIFISSTAKSVFPKVILPEKDIQSLDELYKFYTEYNAEAGKLFHSLDKKKINEETALEKIKKLKSKAADKNAELNKLVLWIPHVIDKRITIESEHHLNRIFFNKFHNE